MNGKSKPNLTSTAGIAFAPLDRPTPAARVLGALILATAIATLPSVNGRVALAVLACAVAAAIAARPNLRRLSTRLGLALGMVGMLLLPFIVTGDVDRLLRLGLRALGAATVALAYTSDLSGSDLARALSALRAPRALVEVLEGLTLQLDSLKGTASRVYLARNLRGARGLGAIASVLPELLVQSAERAERVDLARRLRGYECPAPEQCFGYKDVWPLLIAGASAALLHTLAH